MPDPSADGRYRESDLSTDTLEARDVTGEDEAPRRRLRVTDVAFFVFFAAFFASVVTVVLLGVYSVLTAGSATMHESFHERAFGVGPLAHRIYERIADAAHPETTGLPTGLSAWLSVAFSAVNLALAVFLLWLRPRDRTARLLAIGMVGTAAVFNLPSQVAIEVQPLLLDEQIGHTGAHLLTGAAYTIALLTFPDGRVVPRWRWWALVILYLPLAAAVAVLPVVVEGNARPAALLLFFGLVVPVGGVLAQAYRFRTSDDPAEHQQARLLFWAFLPAIGVGVWFLVTQGTSALDIGLAGRHLPEQPVAVFRVFQPVFLLIPLALFLGLIRYRLWDIDRVVNRTLVYGLATGIVAGAGLGIVILLQRAAASDHDTERPRRGGLDARGLRRVGAGAAADPGLRRPALLPSPLRRAADDRSVQLATAQPARPRGTRVRAAGGRRRDDAAERAVAARKRQGRPARVAVDVPGTGARLSTRSTASG